MKRMTKFLGVVFCMLLVCFMITANAEIAPFKVVISVPNGWTNAASIDATIRVEELADKTMTRLEYKYGKEWQDITEGYKNANDGCIAVPVTDNKTLRVRITDSDGQQLTDEKEIECFDREAPKVSAVINGTSLDIVAQDQLSGVAGVQVNGLLFTVLDGDSMSIPITDTLSKYERLAIRAFDYAGNFTEPVSMINTCYEKQPDPTPAPTATQKPKQEKEEQGKQTAAPTDMPASVTDKKTTGASSVYVSEKASYTVPSAEPVPTPTPIIEKVVETVYETEYITLGPGMPYQSDGNSHTLDMLYSAATIAELKHHRGEQFSIKQMERTRKQLENRLSKLEAEDKKDHVVTFEQLGVDRLFVDEAHMFKNLFLFTKMRNVAGLSASEAQKSSDMFMKCRYMDEITDGRGTVFATGTPVSNSMTELYTMQRYLQYGMLQQKEMSQFDAWASTFGETTTAIELAPEGTGYRARTRFAKFFNLPELMTMFKEVADIKTADQLNLPTPTAHYETVAVKPSEYQQEMVQALSERAAAIHSGSVDPSVDNMLKITSDGRKLGLDQRLINPLLPDDPGSKVNACVNNILRIWREGQDEKLTQLVFCDLSTPRGKAATEKEQNAELLVPEETGTGSFNIYDDIRSKLIANGMPAEQIAFIHDANTELRKKELFAKVRSGQVRVLMGSTAKMGAGTNVQDRLIASHDLDCPWRPGDLEQRAGRIVRQGNHNKDVYIYRYVTEGSFDSYLWQTVENKQKFISQIMSSKSPVRSCDDVDETALSYAEIKALCAGDPRIKEKMDLDVDVARLRLMKADHQSKQYRLEDQLLKHFPHEIERDKQLIDAFHKDIALLEAHPLPEKDFVGMTVDGQVLTEKEAAGKAILASCKNATKGIPVTVGTYRGMEVSVQYDLMTNHFQMTLRGSVSHRTEVGNSAEGNVIRMDNVLASIPKRLNDTEVHMASMNLQIDAAKAEVGKPFPQEAELKVKSARLAELDAELNMDKQPEKEQAKKEEPER